MHHSFINGRLSTPPLWLRALLLGSVITAVWWPSLDASFQFDDWNVIVNEPRVQSLSAWLAAMPGMRPLLKLSYALNHALGHGPRDFRVFNMVVHVLNATLITALFTLKGLQQGLTATRARWTALLTGLLFALHPAQTEAVTYISGRSSSLAVLFSLLSLYAWARSETAVDMSARRRYITACCCTLLLAVAVKETALVMPLLFWLWSAGTPGSPGFAQRLWIPLAVAIAALGIAWLLPAYQQLLSFSLNIRSVGDNLLTQAHALLYLAGQLLRINHMNADPQLVTVTQPDLLSIMLLAMWLMLAGWSLRQLRRSSTAAFAILWFLVCLLPTNTLLPRLDTANDRQLYLALAGPSWLVASCSTRFRLQQTFPGKLTIAALLALLALNTVRRNEVYATEISFWQTAAAQNPASARAANNLGMAYALACQPQEADSEFERAIALEPQDFHARINRQLLRAGTLPGTDRSNCDAE
ncbi:MAG: hypothetical protein AB7T07_14135 [Steroidobacteraceae bacterium]